MWGSTIGCIVTLILSLLTVPRTSQAQPTAPVPRLGLLMLGSASGSASGIDAFRQGLRDLGYVEGQNIMLESRYAEGRFERLPDLVAELMHLKVDVLVTSGSPTGPSAPARNEYHPYRRCDPGRSGWDGVCHQFRAAGREHHRAGLSKYRPKHQTAGVAPGSRPRGHAHSSPVG
jgi:hypothetical protein